MGASPSLAPASNPDVQAERRRALRALLRRPMLPADGDSAAEYAIVRRHFEWLKHWFETFPAWNLSLDKAVARLRKLPGDFSDSTRTAVDSISGAPFTRRRYALLCLVLAVLEQTDQATTLSQIARKVEEYPTTRAELRSAGFVFDCGNYDHRRDLMHTVRLLSGIGALRKTHGDEKTFLNRNDGTDIRYTINRHVLSVMLQGFQSPSEIDGLEKRTSGRSATARISKLADHSIPATDEARSLGLQARLVRSLLNDPVLYMQDLNEEEKHYFEKHRNRLLREVHEATGLIGEVRSEGVAMLDHAGDLTDIRLPDRGSEGQFILPMAQWFASKFKGNAENAISVSDVEAQVQKIAQKEITHDLLLRFRALRLLVITDSAVLPLPGIFRYAAGEDGPR